MIRNQASVAAHLGKKPLTERLLTRCLFLTTASLALSLPSSANGQERTARFEPVKVEFFEKDVDAGCKFRWKSEKIAKQIVPASVLSH